MAISQSFFQGHLCEWRLAAGVSRVGHLGWRLIKGDVTKSPFGKATCLVHYELLNVEDDEDVELMFDVHKQWPQLGYIELYVTFEDGNPLYDVGQPSSSTTPDPEYHFQTQNTYSFQNYESYQPELYFDQAETSEPEPYIPLGDMADFDQQEISEDSEEETYFDEDEDEEEDEDDEDDNDNGDDLEYDPPFYMHASLEIGIKFNSKLDCQLAIKHYHIKHSLNYRVVKSDQYRIIPSLTLNIICESIKSLLKADPSIKVKVIIAHIRERCNYTITYKKAWMAKNKATETIYGNWEKSYNDLPRYALNESSFKYYRNEIKMENPEALRLIDNISPRTMDYGLFSRSTMGTHDNKRF
uniref:Uncharacterized protein LOC101499490 n=1 Tax=Cicer arietinum TaxID=3827 RepID=A0A1S2Y5M7_CICAR|nr:uncharacterized protein LOC101499490 [Cicer arietinum]